MTRKITSLFILILSSVSFSFVAQQNMAYAQKSHKSRLRTTVPISLTKFTIASWNIGHFALGKKNDTNIQPHELSIKSLDYKLFFNEMNADILALIEYNPLFMNATNTIPSVVTRDAILSNYTNAQLGTKYKYNCNCLFSNGFTVLSSKEIKFSKMVQPRYYLCSNVIINGDLVKIVSTHLDWNEGKDGNADRTLQIQELIEAFKNNKYVILCGDWNVRNTSEYDPFLKAGYNMANHGYMGDLKTAPAGDSPTSCIDNIIVKGFAISNVQILNRPDLSDHCLIKADLTKLQ